MNSRRIQTLKHPRSIAQILIFVFIYKDQLWYSSWRTIEDDLIEAKDFSKNELYNCFEHLDLVLGELEIKLISRIPEGLGKNALLFNTWRSFII
jgi:hypothetical protein